MEATYILPERALIDLKIRWNEKEEHWHIVLLREISDLRANLRGHFPTWRLRFALEKIIREVQGSKASAHEKELCFLLQQDEQLRILREMIVDGIEDRVDDLPLREVPR